MKLKPHERVGVEVAEARALAFLNRKPVYATQVAEAIWPGHSMKPQGAGAAASRILKRLERKKLCRYGFMAYVGQGWMKVYSPPRSQSVPAPMAAISKEITGNSQSECSCRGADRDDGLHERSCSAFDASAKHG